MTQGLFHGHGGGIAEMVTGEGKTLVATLAVYLNAFSKERGWDVSAISLAGVMG